MTKEGVFPVFSANPDLDKFYCDLVKNQTAVLIIELGSPTMMRTEQTVRTTLADQVASLGNFMTVLAI